MCLYVEVFILGNRSYFPNWLLSLELQQFSMPRRQVVANASTVPMQGAIETARFANSAPRPKPGCFYGLCGCVQGDMGVR